MVELRIGIAVAAALLLRASYVLHLARAPLIGEPFFAFTLALTSGLALVLFGIAAFGKLHPRLRWIVVVVCLLDIVLRAGVYAQTATQPTLVTSQSALYAEFASELLLRGENPYAWDYRAVSTLYNVGPNQFALPSDDLPVAYSLPSLSFLVLLPFQLLQLPAAFTLSMLAYAITIILIFRAAPLPYQPLIVIPLIIGDALALSALTQAGSLEMVWATLLIGVIVLWNRPRWRAILFGCTLSILPIAWLLFPCLLIQLWWTEADRRRTILQFIGYSVGIFLVLNLPFVLWNATAWFTSLQRTLTVSTPIYGQGIAQLSLFGLIILPATFYQLSAASVFLILLFLLFRHFNTMQKLMWLFPAIVGWWLPQPIAALGVICVLPALIALLNPLPQHAHITKTIRFRASIMGGLAAAAALLLLGLVTVGEYAPLLEAHIEYPLRVNELGQIIDIPIEVSNQSNLPIEPRFSVLTSSLAAPQQWSVVGEDVILPPGENALVHIRGDQAFFSMGEVIVEDNLGGRPQVFALGPYNDYIYPDSVFNSSFDLWSQRDRVPLGWSLASQPSAIAQVDPITLEGKNALVIRANALANGLNTASLQTNIIFPLDPIGFWVYLDVPETINPASLLYGIELQTETKRVLILFTTVEQPPVITPTLYVSRTAIEPRRWIYQEINFAEIFATAGWELPNSEYVTFRDTEGDYALATLRLTVAITGSIGNIEGIFGAIEQRTLYIDPARLMGQTFANPGNYYAHLGQQYMRMRNYHRAVDAYLTALQYQPRDAELLTQLVRARIFADNLPFGDR